MLKKKCIDPVFVKVMKDEIVLLTCLFVIINGDDSKANYDKSYTFVINNDGEFKGSLQIHCIVSRKMFTEVKSHQDKM